MNVIRHIIVRGRVQGVGYRWYCTRAAADFAIAGTVRNLPAGDAVEKPLESVETGTIGVAGHRHEKLGKRAQPHFAGGRGQRPCVHP